MRLTPLLLLFVFILSFSCGDKSQQETAKPQWVLESKRFFRYTHTPTGQIDSTYILFMRYENAQKKDSTSFFIKNIYDNKRLVEKVSYKLLPNQKPEFLGKYTYAYNNNGMTTQYAVYKRNALIKQENYYYDTANRLISYRGIFSKQGNTDAENDDEVLMADDNNTSLLFDTINLKYEFDTTNRVVRSVATDNAGKQIRTDVNIYSGGSPLASYSFGPNGDTLMKTSYQPEGRMIKTVSTNDTMVLTRMLTRTMAPLAQVTENKRTGKMYRRVNTFGEGGLRETSYYILKK